MKRKPTKKRRQPTKKRRRCLWCNKSFWSTGPGNRQCYDCSLRVDRLPFTELPHVFRHNRSTICRGLIKTFPPKYNYPKED